MSEKETKRQCCTCRWWRLRVSMPNPQGGSEVMLGVCRYRPPAPSGWPITAETDQCKVGWQRKTTEGDQ